jgi:4-amino-4-deoxy-L-arabinose transferase-like glycosyltransferase
MLVAVLAALGALALAALVRRLAGRVAAALAAALLVTLPHYQTLGRQLLIGLPALAVALAALALAFWLADGRRGAGGAFLAGLVFGASLLIKPLTAPMLLPLALWCLLPPDWPATRRLRWRRGLWLAVGIALPAAAALAYYGSRAMAGQIVGTLLGAREGQDYTLGSNLAEIGVYLAADRWGLAYWGLPALAALGLGELWAARRRRELLVLAAWLLAAFAALALHTPLRGHEMILLMPPLLACGAMGIDAAVRLAGARRPAGGRRFLAAAGAMATVVAVLGTIGAVRADVQVRAEEMAAALPADDARILALLAETPAGSTIIVDDPMLAFESQRTIPRRWRCPPTGGWRPVNWARSVAGIDPRQRGQRPGVRATLLAARTYVPGCGRTMPSVVPTAAWRPTPTRPWR